MLRKLSSRQGHPSKKRIIDHVTSLIDEMSSQHIQKNFPGLLYTAAKYEKNLPYDCEAITKRKCGSGGVASPTYKEVSLTGRLNMVKISNKYFYNLNTTVQNMLCIYEDARQRSWSN